MYNLLYLQITVHHVVYGITQDQETKNYMVVLDDICEKCNRICNTIYFQRNFENWTSGDDDLDKIIQDSQLSEHTYYVKNALEWIPYDRFCDIKYIAKGEFGKVYKANWIDGHIDYWNNYDQNWIREDQNMFVILKSLNDPTSITSEFINKVQ